jgi:hypothetical protein
MTDRVERGVNRVLDGLFLPRVRDDRPLTHSRPSSVADSRQTVPNSREQACRSRQARAAASDEKEAPTGRQSDPRRTRIRRQAALSTCAVPPRPTEQRGRRAGTLPLRGKQARARRRHGRLRVGSMKSRSEGCCPVSDLTVARSGRQGFPGDRSPAGRFGRCASSAGLSLLAAPPTCPGCVARTDRSLSFPRWFSTSGPDSQRA